MDQQNKTARATAYRAVAKGDHSEPAEHQSRQSARRTFKGSRIRVPILMLALIGSVIAGIIFILLAIPGRESANLLLSPPLRVDAFATSPNVTIRLNMIINTSRSCSGGTAAADCAKGFVGDLYGTIAGPDSTSGMNPDGKILIMSTRPAYPPSGFLDLPPVSTKTAVWVDTRSHAVPSMPDIHLFSISIRKIEQNQGYSLYGAPIAKFMLPSVTENAKGSFFGHLPHIGWISNSLNSSSTESTSSCTLIGTPSRCESGSSSTFEITGLLPVATPAINTIPWILTEERHLHGKSVNDMIFFPAMKEQFDRRLAKGHVSEKDVLKLAQNPSNYPTIPGSQHALYWPTKLLATEVLAGAQSSLAHARIDSILPVNGSLQGDSYVWQGTGSLEPTISATKINAAESQSTYAFASGIAFATAAAAFIALMQEVPNDIPFPRWWPRWHGIKRKRNNPPSAERTDCGLGWPG
jgi:hypothetical protein